MISYHIPHEYAWNYEGDYLPQSCDLQYFDDHDDAMTNVQMAEYSAAKRWDASVDRWLYETQLFIGRLFV